MMSPFRWIFVAAATVLPALAAGGCASSYYQPEVGTFAWRPDPQSSMVVTVPRPSLFFRREDVARMKEAMATVPEAKARWDDLLARTDPDRLVEYPVAGALTQPDWARVSGIMGGMAARCGLLYQMTGDRRYADWVRRMLLGWAKEFDSRVDFRLCGDYRGTETGHAGQGGNTMGYFFVGELLTWTAMAYDCVYQTLSAEDRATIEGDYFRKWVAALESFDYSQRMPGKAPDYMIGGGQWNGANLCTMGLTAVGLVLRDERLAARGIRNFKTHLGRDMLSDGFWIEEDRSYSDICMGSLFVTAWMARSSGYSEDLFALVERAQPRQRYDPRYYTAIPESDGPAPAERSLRMYLDAQIDYQYPTLGPGNWGWLPGRGSLRNSSQLIGMYELGNAVYGGTGSSGYAWLLKNVDRNRGGLGAGGLELLYFARPLGDPAPPETRSRWYPHQKWLVLKSVEGRAYWGSDSLYAFVPYGFGRTKGLEPLTLDLFGFGRVLAARTTISDYAQNLTKAYQLNEPAWNTVMVDGCNPSTFRGRSDRQWMAYWDTGSLAKVAAPRVHWIGERRAELDLPAAARRQDEDSTLGRTLLMTDRYVVDVFHVAYDRPPAYKHNFDYVLHGAGQLSFEKPGRSDGRFEDQVAVWRQEDGVGLRTTILSAMPRGGTKLKKYADQRGEFLVATRGDFEERFIVVHEPLKGESKISKIQVLHEEAEVVALRIDQADGTVDLVALRIRPGEGPTGAGRAASRRFETSVAGAGPLVLDGNYTFVRVHGDGRQQRQGK